MTKKRQQKNVLLVNPANHSDFQSSLRYGIYPPLNLAVLKAYIQSKSEEFAITLWDGQISTLDPMMFSSFDVVGISCNVMTYEPALKIAELANEKGCQVVLGGPYASAKAEQILLNRPYIDAIICNDGEEALLQYLEEKSYIDIPNLAFRNEKQIVLNSCIKTNLKEYLIPDYSSLPLEDYFANFRKQYSSHKPFNASLATYSRKGCRWRDVTKGGCVFCMIPHFGVESREHEHIWKEIQYFSTKYKVDMFWDVSDNFLEDEGWIDEFINTRPSDNNTAFHIYGRPSNINQRIAKKLKQLNVYEVFIGTESGDNRILKNSVKGCTVDHTIRAIELLAVQNIKVIVSFVLGLPGETDETLYKTVKLAERVSKYENVIETSTGIMIPLPGSNAYSDLLKIKGFAEKYNNTDLVNLSEMQEDWINNFTKVDFDSLNYYQSYMCSLFDVNKIHNKVQKDLKAALYC